jgi:hypothetical protein
MQRREINPTPNPSPSFDRLRREGRLKEFPAKI